MSIRPFNNHDFVDITSGMSCMGSDALDPFAGDRERPTREVFISTFGMSKHATTFLQYAVFLKDINRVFPQAWGKLDHHGWPDILEEREDFPVTNISWENAFSYCEWLSEKCDVHIGLPTEAEWEKAARGGDDRIWPWGDKFDPQLCNCAEKGDSIRPVTDFPRRVRRLMDALIWQAASGNGVRISIIRTRMQAASF